MDAEVKKTIESYGLAFCIFPIKSDCCGAESGVFAGWNQGIYYICEKCALEKINQGLLKLIPKSDKEFNKDCGCGSKTN